MDYTEKYPLHYPLRPATLKQFASTRVALDLWHNKGFDLTDSIISCPEEEFKCEEMLNIVLPPTIRNIVNKRISSIRQELEKLFDKFNRLSSITNLNDNALECLDCITYGPDATLSTVNTARNLLTSDEMSEFAKYMIACVYRSDEEIKKIWPSMFDHLFVNIKNGRELHRMRYFTDPPDASNNANNVALRNPEFYFYELMDCSDWSGLEYFLGGIAGTEEQCRVLSSALNTRNFRNIKYVLPRLNKALVDYFLKTYPVHIITVLALEEGYFEYVLKIWSLVNDSLIDTQFHLLITTFFQTVYINADYWDYDQILQTKMIFYEIWISARDRLKNSFFPHIQKMLDSWDIIFGEKLVNNEDYSLDVKFFTCLLADMPFQLRKALWNEHWLLFLISFSLEHFDKFMRLCLKNNEIKKFAKVKMLDYDESSAYIEFLYRTRLYNDVIEYFNFCSTLCEDRFVQEFIKIVKIHLSISVIDMKFDKLIEFSVFVSKMSKNIVEANEIHKNIFYVNEFQKLLVSKLKQGFIREVISITEHFLVTRRSTIGNQIFQDYWCTFLTVAREGVIRRRWNEFISWRECNENGWPMFKEFIPVDEIFEKLFLEALPKFTLWLGDVDLKRMEPMPSLSIGKLEEFSLVDNFLRCYFGTEIEVRNYKLNKILNYRNIVGIKYLLNINNECIINDTLRWFFNDNFIEIEIFKDLYIKNERL